MATLKLCQHLSCLKQLEVRAFHTSASQTQKQYSYNLNSLLKWKEETERLFGPQRKPTKTGKLKKRKKELDEEVQGNVKALSLYSKSAVDFNDANSNITVPITAFQDVSDKVLSTVTPVDAVSFHVTNRSSEFSVDYVNKRRHNSENISDYRYKSSKTEKSPGSSKGVKSKSKKTHDDDKMSEAVMYPDPPHNFSTNTGVFQEESQSGLTDTESQEGKKSSKHQGWYDKKATTSSEIHIPKIQPIPVKNAPSSTAPLKKILLPSMPSPPVQAPQSFDVISRFPFMPHSEPVWQEGGEEAQHLHKFKMDVERMALRTLPSVKTILNRTMSDLSRFLLHRWREGLIKELGEEGFNKHKHETMRQGTNLHANIMEFLSGKPESELQIMAENEGHWSSLQQALKGVSDIKALETEVLHPALLYRGVYDCVACYKDLLCVIDWKVSKKPKPLLKNTYDDPLQVAAYVGALNANSDYVKQYGEINHGLIVVVYPDGSPAHVHMLNKAQVEQYWQDWLARLYSYFLLTYADKVAQKKLGGAG